MPGSEYYDEDKNGSPKNSYYMDYTAVKRTEKNLFDDGVEKWDKRFLELAQHVSKWSKDPSTKCGAIITNGKKVLGMGYNGFPAGTDDDASIYADRPRKLARVVHAELNAVYAALQSGHPTQGSTLYTWPPGMAPTCDRCAAHVIQAGVKRIVFCYEDNEFTRRWSPEEALKMYAEAGIDLVRYKWHTGYDFSGMGQPMSITRYQETRT